MGTACNKSNHSAAGTLLRESKEVVLITEHGQPSAWLVDVQDYDFMQRGLALLEGLSKGERAILEGKATSHSKAKERMRMWLLLSFRT